MSEERQAEMQDYDNDFITNVVKKVKQGHRFYGELVITKVTGGCPYGHREGETFRITNMNNDGVCGALVSSIHHQVIINYYGGTVPWEKDTTIFTGRCPEFGKVEVEIRRRQKDDDKMLKTAGSFKDMTDKGFPALDKYRIYVEILDVGQSCSWGHRAGQRFEVDPFNIGDVCSMLYCQAYENINLLLSEKNMPWAFEEHIAEMVCPDTYNQTSFRLVREPR